MSYQEISFKVEDNVAYIGFGAKEGVKMPVLSKEVLMELKDIVDETKVLAKEKNIKGAIFHSNVEGVFLAGADIKMIGTIKNEQEASEGASLGQQLFNEIEDLGVPTVAAVDGVCLGGGLELAMSCRTIIVTDSKKTSLGLPEVQLGILPGFGGTYRLPKRVGLPNSLDMILSGRRLNSKKAKKWGLATEVYATERIMEMAIKHFDKPVKKKKDVKEKVMDLAQENFFVRKLIFQKAREGVFKKTKGFYQAPLKILDHLEAAFGKSRAQFLKSEAKAFGELCTSDQSKNLRHLFFLMESGKKYNGPKSTKDLLELDKGACLGAGTMGGGIAWLMANAGMHPIMKDIGTEALELGLKQASSNFSGALKRKRISKAEFERMQRSIAPQLDYNGFKSIDLLVEAIVEIMDVKKSVLAETEGHVSDDCLLTSNTSSLSVQEMSTALKKPERFAGLHFFNPVHKMPLVEIITHDKCAPETLEALHKWCLRVKKTPVIVKDGPGFLVNRILSPFLNESCYLLEEGVSFEAIEEASLNFGMPMGPFTLMDEVGIDVGEKVAKILLDGLGARQTPCEFAKHLIKEGAIGKKSSKGFYLYDENGKKQGRNPVLDSVLPKTTIKMDEIEIQKRIVLPMINEASYILEEGIASSAGDVDLALIFGIGFPPFRGGLLKYADHEGASRLYDTLMDFSSKVSADRFAPSAMFKTLAETGGTFYKE